jgi:hypothetical protein
MARFQVTGPGWPVGQYLIPADTFLDKEDWQWNGIALPTPLPVCLRPLDDEAYAELLKWHKAHLVARPPA